MKLSNKDKKSGRVEVYKAAKEQNEAYFITEEEAKAKSTAQAGSFRSSDTWLKYLRKYDLKPADVKIVNTAI